jgi:hypothetical protein
MRLNLYLARALGAEEVPAAAPPSEMMLKGVVPEVEAPTPGL